MENSKCFSLFPIFTDAYTMPLRRYTGLCKPWRLSPQLQSIVGVPSATRIECTKLLWRYVKLHHLQDPHDKRFFYPDYRMVQVFGYGRLKCIQMAKYLTPHLRPMPDL